MNHTLRLVVLSILCFVSMNIKSQDMAIVEGYVYESGNRGYLAVVQVTAINKSTNVEIAKVFTDNDGFFKFESPSNVELSVSVLKDMFENKSIDFKAVANEKNFIQFEMKREPGYIFEITMAESRDDENITVDAIKGARIEVYNNTTQKEELVLEDYQNPEFRVNLIKGNHYTILIRKEGYLAKRMEAFVNIKGCILCFEGIGSVRPGVVENLTEGNNNGILLANVGLEKVFAGKKMAVQNIYYDLGKWSIKTESKKELDNVVQLMKDNPKLTIELGSHTDSQGKSAFNQELSEKRATAAVEYLLRRGDVRRGSITSKGYGESQITNKCADGVKCSDKEHAINRRTELKVTGFYSDSRFKTLAEMKREETLESEILSGESSSSGQLVLLPGETLEDALARVNGESKKDVEENISNIEEHSMIQSDIESKVEPKPSKLGGLSIDVPMFSNQANGSFICVYNGEEKLPMTHRIYKIFSNVKVYNDQVGQKLYIIDKVYGSKDEANSYLKSYISPDFPDAQVVDFIDGKLMK